MPASVFYRFWSVIELCSTEVEHISGFDTQTFIVTSERKVILGQVQQSQEVSELNRMKLNGVGQLHQEKER